MNKEERKQKMDEFNEKMKELNAKIKDSTDTLVLEGMEAKNVLGKKLKDAQSSLEATKEQSVALSLLAAKEAKVAFLEALDAQMEYDEKYGEE